jgi:hypothetical protein
MSIFIKLINYLIEFFAYIVTLVLNVLPDSPFNWGFVQSFLDSPYVKFAVYFIPFDSILAFLEVYVTAVFIWYAYRWVLRVIKYIQ